MPVKEAPLKIFCGMNSSRNNVIGHSRTTFQFVMFTHLHYLAYPWYLSPLQHTHTCITIQTQRSSNATLLKKQVQTIMFMLLVDNSAAVHGTTYKFEPAPLTWRSVIAIFTTEKLKTQIAYVQATLINKLPHSAHLGWSFQLNIRYNF